MRLFSSVPGSTHKFDKNSILILKRCTFVIAMENVCRTPILFLLLVLNSFAFSLSGKTPLNSGDDGLNPFKSNGKVGLKNQKGEIIIPALYDGLGWSNGTFSMTENVTGYLIGGKWGLLNL